MHEHALIRRLQEGDPTAIDELVDEYKAPLFAFIMRLVNNHDMAEDLFQETWIKVIRSVRRFRGDAKLSTWLFQVALNHCRDEMRKKRYVHVPLEEVEELAGDSTPDLDRLHLAKEIQKIVEGLPIKMREVVVLKYFHDLKDEEIACVAGIPAGTVKSRLHRASEIIREKWTKINTYQAQE